MESRTRWIIGTLVVLLVGLVPLLLYFRPFDPALRNPQVKTEYAFDYSGQTYYVSLGGEIFEIPHENLSVSVNNPNIYPIAIKRIEVTLKEYTIPDDYQITSWFSAGGDVNYAYELSLPARVGKYSAKLVEETGYDYVRVAAESSEVLSIDLFPREYGVYTYEVEIFYTIQGSDKAFKLDIDGNREFQLAHLPKDKIIFYCPPSLEGVEEEYLTENHAQQDQLISSVDSAYEYLLRTHDDAYAFIDYMTDDIKASFAN